MILEAIKIIVLSCTIYTGDSEYQSHFLTDQKACQAKRTKCFINKVAGHSTEIQVADALAACMKE